MPELLSIVMPCHNRCDALRLTLESLACQDCSPEDFEVIVVDQASTDGSREVVRQFEAPFRLRLLPQDAKYGISVARNGGIQEAAAERILLLDADLVTDPHLVTTHLAAAQQHPDALIRGRVLPYPPAYDSFTERAANPEAGLDRGEAPGPMPFYQALGGHMSFSKAAFARIGPFDPQLKGFEDTEFAFRAGQLGILLYNHPEAISYHNHPRTLRQRFEQARSYNRMLPVMFERFPELRGTVPLLQDYEPLRWGQDGPARLLSKLSVRFYGLPIYQTAAYAALRALNQVQIMPGITTRLARFIFWRALIGNWYLGFRAGAADLRRAAPASPMLTTGQ